MATDHIPKRAVQNGIYMPSEEVPPVALKPGQKDLQSSGFYTAEVGYTRHPEKQEPATLQDRGIDSEYSKLISKASVPEDYKNPVRPHRKAVFERSGPEGSEAVGGSHWVSEYRAASSEGASRMATPRMTAEQILASKAKTVPQSCVSRTADHSCYLADFGRHGSNPRDKLSKFSSHLPVSKNAMTAGTPRGTAHIPGYQGFIPSYPGFNEPLLRAASGENTRSIDKTNIIHIFHKDLIGYSGHVPEDVNNDFGGRKPNTATVFGHDFQPHKKGALR